MTEYTRHDGDKRDDQRKMPDNDDDQNMLNIGEFSPNNPKMRVATQPFLGLGEYDHRRQMLNDQRKAEYQQYSEQVHYELSKKEEEQLKVSKGQSTATEKQTKNMDIPQSGYNNYMDRIGVVTSTSPRAKLMADLQSQCFPSAMGYIPPNTVDDDRFEKVRKQEKYMGELKKQVEEKKMLEKKHKEDELIEDDLESARVVTQQRNLNFNKQAGFGYGRHCYSSEYTGSVSNEQPQ